MWKEQLAAPAKTALCIPDMRMPIGPGLSCHHIKVITAPTCRERRCSLRVFRVKRGLCSARLEGASLIHTCMCADVWPHACLVFSILSQRRHCRAPDMSTRACTTTIGHSARAALDMRVVLENDREHGQVSLHSSLAPGTCMRRPAPSSIATGRPAAASNGSRELLCHVGYLPSPFGEAARAGKLH